MLFVTAEVDSLTSKHERFLWQLRSIHWHQNTNAFFDSWGRFTNIKTRTVFVIAEVDSLTSKHKCFLWQLRSIHWHQNTNAFCDSWGRFTDIKTRMLFVTAEVDPLTSIHERFLPQLRWIHWHHNTHAFCEHTTDFMLWNSFLWWIALLQGWNFIPSREKQDYCSFILTLSNHLTMDAIWRVTRRTWPPLFQVVGM